jgi:hypothetical protein
MEEIKREWMKTPKGWNYYRKENKSKYKPRRGVIKKSIDEPEGSLAISIQLGRWDGGE